MAHLPARPRAARGARAPVNARITALNSRRPAGCRTRLESSGALDQWTIVARPGETDLGCAVGIGGDGDSARCGGGSAAGGAAPVRQRAAPSRLSADGSEAQVSSVPCTPGPRRRRGRRGQRGRGSQPRGARGGGWRVTDHAWLLIGSLNVQSVKPKLLELSQELHRFSYDVMALQETWLKPSTPSRLLSLPGYRVYRTDRPDGRGYGGVALAIRTGTDATQLKVPERRHPGSALETVRSLLKLDMGRQLIVASCTGRQTKQLPPLHRTSPTSRHNTSECLSTTRIMTL